MSYFNLPLPETSLSAQANQKISLLVNRICRITARLGAGEQPAEQNAMVFWRAAKAKTALTGQAYIVPQRLLV